MISRRKVVRLALAGVALSACGTAAAPRLSCTATHGLSPDEIQMRNAQNYVDQVASIERACRRCTFYQATTVDQCGACTVIKGPIHPDGSCDLFAA